VTSGARFAASAHWAAFCLNWSFQLQLSYCWDGGAMLHKSNFDFKWGHPSL